jgi:hypothetical protein
VPRGGTLAVACNREWQEMPSSTLRRRNVHPRWGDAVLSPACLPPTRVTATRPPVRGPALARGLQVVPPQGIRLEKSPSDNPADRCNRCNLDPLQKCVRVEVK